MHLEVVHYASFALLRISIIRGGCWWGCGGGKVNIFWLFLRPPQLQNRTERMLGSGGSWLVLSEDFAKHLSVVLDSQTVTDGGRPCAVE
jgi:hypothetical protein